jgi:hypothetical protein
VTPRFVLPPQDRQTLARLEALALRIILDHPQRDVVAFDQVLGAAQTAHAIHHHCGCGVEEALAAYDLPREALPIALHLVGLTMGQAEVVRMFARGHLWAENFRQRAAERQAPGATPAPPQ